MRLFNWRRQAVLNAMPLVKPDQVRTPWHEFWRRFRRQHMAMTAALFVILLIVVAIFARWIAPYDAENYFDYDNLNNGPSLQHWFWCRFTGARHFQPCPGWCANLAGGGRVCRVYRCGDRDVAGLAGWIL